MTKKLFAADDQNSLSPWSSATDTENILDLDLCRTMLFHSKQDEHLCNSFSANFYRQRVRVIHKWARQLGFNTFLADYSTPFGLLTLETLLELRKGDDSFRVFSFRSRYVGKRRTYRATLESDLELILLVSQADYCYSGSSPKTFFHIVSQVPIVCTERIIWIGKECPYLFSANSQNHPKN